MKNEAPFDPRPPSRREECLLTRAPPFLGAFAQVTHIVGNPAVWRTLKGLDLTSYRCMLVISDELEMGDLMVRCG